MAKARKIERSTWKSLREDRRFPTAYENGRHDDIELKLMHKSDRIEFLTLKPGATWQSKYGEFVWKVRYRMSAKAVSGWYWAGERKVDLAGIPRDRQLRKG